MPAFSPTRGYPGAPRFDVPDPMRSLAGALQVAGGFQRLSANSRAQRAADDQQRAAEQQQALLQQAYDAGDGTTPGAIDWLDANRHWELRDGLKAKQRDVGIQIAKEEEARIGQAVKGLELARSMVSPMIDMKDDAALLTTWGQTRPFLEGAGPEVAAFLPPANASPEAIRQFAGVADDWGKTKTDRLRERGALLTNIGTNIGNANKGIDRDTKMGTLLGRWALGVDDAEDYARFLQGAAELVGDFDVSSSVLKRLPQEWTPETPAQIATSFGVTVPKTDAERPGSDYRQGLQRYASSQGKTLSELTFEEEMAFNRKRSAASRAPKSDGPTAGQYATAIRDRVDRLDALRALWDEQQSQYYRGPKMTLADRKQKEIGIWNTFYEMVGDQAQPRRGSIRELSSAAAAARSPGSSPGGDGDAAFHLKLPDGSTARFDTAAERDRFARDHSLTP